MDIFKAIDSRYTYRGGFLDSKLTKDEIEKILKAGISAPTGMRITTTNYIAIEDKEIIEKLAEWVPGIGITTAPFVIVIITENFAKPYGVNFEVENYAVAVENILLAITALGLATIWTDGVLRSPQVNNGVREILEIPSSKTIRAVLPIGRPEVVGSPIEKEEISDVVHYNKFTKDIKSRF